MSDTALEDQPAPPDVDEPPQPADDDQPPADDVDDAGKNDDAGDDELGDEQRRRGKNARRDEEAVDAARVRDSLEREAVRHRKRLGEILGEDDAGELLQCELCPPLLPGWRPPVTPDEDQRRRVDVALGRSDMERFKTVPSVFRCQTCNGEGSIATESNVDGERTVRCLDCNGRGWNSNDPRRQPQVRGTVSAAPAIVDDVNTPLEPKPDLDPWGTPPEDPEYGMMPQYRSDAGRERIAARLAAAG